MPKYFVSAKPDPDDFEKRIHPLKSDRKVRPVVTPSGHRARGRFPSLKGSKTQYESLVEEDALRIFEIATTVCKVHTHPYMLELRTGSTAADKTFHYTPDAMVTFVDTSSLIEVKGDWLLELPGPKAGLLRTLQALRQHEVPIALMTETDIRPAGLQDQLKQLLRTRPACIRLRKNIDTTEWDPTGAVEPDGDTLRRWRAAQWECDALLDRVIRRDPDELIESLLN